MRAQEIVDKLSARVPLFTDGFSESLSISSIAVAGTVATVTTPAAHGLVDGQNVAILGVQAPVQVDTASFSRVGTLATFNTLQDHDVTLSQLDKNSGGKTITISGAAEPEFNGTFQLANVPNRRTLVMIVADAGPITISGAPIVEEAGVNVFNGLFPATNLTANTFDYVLPVTYPLDPIVTGATVQTYIRVLSALNIEQYLQTVYTDRPPTDDTLVVQLGDVTASKKRNEESDASSSSSANYAHSPLLIQPFAVYIVMNVTDDLTASDARDKVESEYIPAIFHAVLRAQFDTGFTYRQHRATFTGHGVFAYSDVNSKGTALYVHEITFEQLATLTGVDMADENESRAMRDIEYALTTNLGTGTLDATVDLDEEPL